MSSDEGFENIDRDEVEMGMEAQATNNESKNRMISDLQEYIKTNGKKSTFVGWIAHTDDESIRINPRLRYKDSIQRIAWNDTIKIERSLFRSGNSGLQLPESRAIKATDAHADCGWPKTPLTIVASAKKINRRKSRKGKKPKKRKTRKTRRGRK